MNVVVLGSGSRGNAVAITTDQATILIDAGFSPRAMRRRATVAVLTCRNSSG